MNKRIELDITVTPCGTIHSFYSKGHHDFELFKSTLRASSLFEEIGEDEGFLEEAEVLHVYWRKVPDSTGQLAWKAIRSKPGPGAFPVTVIYTNI